jgi:tetratricopeptide (TPR) repeat protein
LAISDEFFDQLLADGPSPSTLFRVLSKMKEGGQIKRVIQECIKALNVYPYDIKIRQLLAECYFDANLLAQAEAELEKVTKQIGVFVSAYKLQAEVYSRQKRLDDASKTLSLYLAHNPEDQDAKVILESLMPSETSLEAEPSPQPEDAAGVEDAARAEDIAGSIERVEDDVPEIATPTLAEVYVNQGQINAAIIIYERVLAQNPNDEASRQRLEALKSEMNAEKPDKSEEVDGRREKKKKLLAILEAWLANIRFMTDTTLPA